jgi:hypothetical protein
MISMTLRRSSGRPTSLIYWNSSGFDANRRLFFLQALNCLSMKLNAQTSFILNKIQNSVERDIHVIHFIFIYLSFCLWSVKSQKQLLSWL